MVATEKRRSEEVRVKLAPGLAAELGEIATGRGLLPATLAAVALGEYVERYRQNLQIQRMVALDASKRMSELSASDEAIDKAVGALVGDPKALASVFSALGAGSVSAGGSGSSAGPEAAAS